MALPIRIDPIPPTTPEMANKVFSTVLNADSNVVSSSSPDNPKMVAFFSRIRALNGNIKKNCDIAGKSITIAK